MYVATTTTTTTIKLLKRVNATNCVRSIDHHLFRNAAVKSDKREKSEICNQAFAE